MLCGFLRRVKGEAKHSLYVGSGKELGICSVLQPQER